MIKSVEVFFSMVWNWKLYLTKTVFLIFLLSSFNKAGTVAVIQPKLTEQAYRTPEIFRESLRFYFDEINKNSTGNESRLVLLPEYHGTWLVSTNEWGSVFNATSINRAMGWIIFRHFFRFVKELISSLVFGDFEGPFMGHVKRAVFFHQAETMRKTYQTVFSDLAQTYQVWIVAGSIILPEADVQDGKICFTKSGRLMNQGFLFNPSGKAVMVSRKVFPLQNELSFLDPAPVSDLKVIDTDFGRLGILVCADSWYPEVYDFLKTQNVDIIAVPSFVTPADLWNDPWRGYDPPGNEPEGINPSDIGYRLEKDMWEKHAVCGRSGSAGAFLGLNSFLTGSFWGMTGAGQSTISMPGEILAKASNPFESEILYYKIPSN